MRYNITITAPLLVYIFYSKVLTAMAVDMYCSDAHGDMHKTVRCKELSMHL